MTAYFSLMLYDMGLVVGAIVARFLVVGIKGLWG